MSVVKLFSTSCEPSKNVQVRKEGDKKKKERIEGIKENTTKSKKT